MREKLVFALLMSLITTGIISLLVLVINLGFPPRFILIWGKSWLIGYLVAVPSILLVAPQIQKWIAHWFRKDESGLKNTK